MGVVFLLMYNTCYISVCELNFVIQAFLFYVPARKYSTMRYMKCLADRFQLKICEGKQKEKSHRTFKIVLHISIRFQLMQSISFVIGGHIQYQPLKMLLNHQMNYLK